MNKLLEIIFNDYCSKPLEDNPLETTENNEIFCDFMCEQFGNMTNQSFDKVYDEFANVIIAYQKRAFEVGFNNALNLLMGAGQE